MTVTVHRRHDSFARTPRRSPKRSTKVLTSRMLRPGVVERISGGQRSAAKAGRHQVTHEQRRLSYPEHSKESDDRELGNLLATDLST